jgi:hypothetical protein
MLCDGRPKLEPRNPSTAWTKPVHRTDCKAHHKTSPSRSGLPSSRMRVYSHRWVRFSPVLIYTNHHRSDIKPDNILVAIPQPETSRIDQYIESNVASIYGPPLNLKSLPLPLVFSCSEPLPYFDLGGSIEDVSVRLADYGEGEYFLSLARSC